MSMAGSRNIKVISVLSAALIVLRAVFSLEAFAFAQEKSYTIGANVKFGTVKTALGNSGLAYDYFEQMAKFTGDRYAYTEGTPEELFRRLLNGTIDIIPCVSEDELALYEKIVSENEANGAVITVGYPMFNKFSAIYVYDKGEHQNTAFGDADVIRHMSIGYLPEDEAVFFENGKFVCSELEDAQFISYNKEDTMKDDFVSGKIDAVVKNCFRPWENETIVYQFDEAPCYFAIRASDKALESKLTEGMERLSMSYPNFAGDIYEKNIANYGAQKFAYSAEERVYLSNNPDFTIGFNLESDIMQTYDVKTETIGGIMGMVADEISDKTGMNIKIKAYKTLPECMKKLSEGEIDAVYGSVPPGGISNYSGYYISSPVTREPVVFAGKEDTTVTQLLKIAVVGNNDEITRYLEYFYPKAGVTPFTDEEVACEMVMSDTCEVVCAGSYDIMYLKNRQFEDIHILDVLPIYRSECFAMRKDSPELCSIVEKALAQINGNKSVLDVHNIIASAEAVSAKDNSHIWLIASVLLALVVLVAGTIVLITLENRRRAEVDALTGGRTKRMFLIDSVKAVRKSDPQKWTVMVFDIDKFKFVNERLGYEEGNRMLERLYKTVSDHIESGEVCARISDDNFALTVRNASDNDLENRLNNIFAEFERRNSLFVSYPVLFSAGICRLGDFFDKYDTVAFNTAIDRCNIAKKSIKGRHCNAIAFYDGKIREKSLREKDYESIMPAALKKHEFMCYIQPKYGTKSRHIEGGEALIRWKSKEFGFVYPNDFIPIAEKNGFVVELDFFILEEVCKAMRRWLDKGKTPVVISVNQSRLHLNNDDYIWRLREIIDKYEIPYEYLELELTESVFTDDAELMLKVMQKLHDIGFKLSIDDFGSGYSSLNMLKDIPADVVKIDREFFNGTVNSQKGRAVISSVVELAKNLDMKVISEGVETIEQVEFLKDIDCQLIQGYYFAKPMPMKEFEALWEKDIAAAEKEKNAQSE